MLRHIGTFVRPRLAQIARGQTILDAGCGEQPLREEIEAAGATYIGLDIEQNRAGTVDLIAPLWNVPIEDASIDTIVLTEVLEHVPDSAGAFREMARLVRGEGTILITTPFAYPLHEEPHDYVRLTPRAIEWLAQQNGFTLTEASTLGNEIEVLALTFCNLLSGMVAPWPFALRVLAGLVRLPFNLLVNTLAAAASVVLSPFLPRKSYLSTACVLTRQRNR